MSESEKILKAIATLEARRSVPGAEVIEVALAPLREKLASL
ncbi:MAG TPA: hypothetical protein VF498_09875 [Anaerolineales bacterium]